jgi:hypothetical protein
MLAVKASLVSQLLGFNIRGIEWYRRLTHVPRNIVGIAVNASDAVERKLVVRGKSLEGRHGSNEQG